MNRIEVLLIPRTSEAGHKLYHFNGCQNVNGRKRPYNNTDTQAKAKNK